MPKEPTPRLKLKNPSTGEFDWDKSWWENTDIIDNYPGILVVTEATLPEEPWVGQHVFNMDDLSLLCWNGANWINQSSGMFDFLIAGTGGVNRGDVVYIDSNGHIQKASNDMEEKYAFRVAGVVLKDLNEGETGLVKKTGMVRCPDWNLSIGKHYFLGTNGGINDIKPDIEENFAQVIGVATAADALSIRISSPYVSYEEIKNYMHTYFVEDESIIKEYGLEWNQTNDTYTRLGDASSLSVPDAGTDGYKNSDFDDKLPWSGMKRCNLADDLTVNAYYDDPTYVTDGSNGQVMVEIPKFWYKTENDTSGDNIYRWWIADGPKEGYEVHPAFIRNGIEKDYLYIGAFEAYDDETKLYSKGNVTTTGNKTIGEFRLHAEARGTGWSQQDLLTTSAIQLLYLIEYADFNSQSNIGNGWVDKLDPATTGQTNGNKSYGYVSDQIHVLSYRGIENFWGSLKQVIDGALVKDDGYYYEDNVSNFNDSASGYTKISVTPVELHGFINDIEYIDNFEFAFIGSNLNGSESTYLTDEQYSHVSNDENILTFGGAYWSGYKAGAFYWYMVYETDYAHKSYGARLLAY